LQPRYGCGCEAKILTDLSITQSINLFELGENP